MAEHYIPSNPFYSATVLHSATEQYRPGSRNADEVAVEIVRLMQNLIMNTHTCQWYR